MTNVIVWTVYMHDTLYVSLMPLCTANVGTANLQTNMLMHHVVK